VLSLRPQLKQLHLLELPHNASQCVPNPTQVSAHPAPRLAPSACPLQLSAQCRPRQYNRRSPLTAPIDNCVQTPHLSLPRTRLPGTCFLHPTTWHDTSPHPATRLACVSLHPSDPAPAPSPHYLGCVPSTLPPGVCTFHPSTHPPPGACPFTQPPGTTPPHHPPTCLARVFPTPTYHLACV
jgi:hypothetical protein